MIIGDCKACDARDMHIESLREQIRNRDAIIDSLREVIEQHSIAQQEMIEHLTGKSRTIPIQTGELHSMPRRGGIADRLKRAEQAERAPELLAQRKKEYQDRIASLEARPETEIVEDGA